MTTLRHTLQQEIFQPNEERLLSMCHVEKYLKKKKVSFLCVITSINPPHNISIVQVKQTDKTFKRKRTWALGELKVVDGKNESNETHEFDLQLDKVYRWVASNLQEKKSIIITLWRQSAKYFLNDKPLFKNVPKSWITEDVMTPENKYQSTPLGLDSDLSEDFQSITEKEQEDLSK